LGAGGRQAARERGEEEEREREKKRERNRSRESQRALGSLMTLCKGIASL
jgi:hypothetical protein